MEPLLKTWSCINLPGRFQHVHLSDTFSMCPASDRPRYKVFQKLGQGAFSTVWIAQDMADHEYYVMFPKHLCRAEYKHLAAVSKSPRQISWNMRPPFSQTLSSPADNSYLGLPSWFLASWTSKGLPMRHCSPWPTYPSGDPLRRWVLWWMITAILLLACSQDLHADNIIFSFPGLAELNVQVWMHNIIWISRFQFLLFLGILRSKATPTQVVPGGD